MKKIAYVLTFVFAILAIVLFSLQEGLRWTVGVDMTRIRFFLTYPWVQIGHYCMWFLCFVFAKFA
jgi:hypothetical protein